MLHQTNKKTTKVMMLGVLKMVKETPTRACPEFKSHVVKVMIFSLYEMNGLRKEKNPRLTSHQNHPDHPGSGTRKVLPRMRRNPESSAAESGPMGRGKK